MGAIIVNKFGNLVGWNKLTYNCLFRDIELITRVAYEDTVEFANAYGANNMPLGRETKNYSATHSFVLYQEELRAILRSLPPGKRLQDIPPFDGIVEYEAPDGKRYKDIIRNIQFTNNGVDVKQSDGSIQTEFKTICSHIDWNVI